MATIKSEYYRFNGVSWDLHYFKTTIDQVVGLQTALDGKAAASHNHSTDNITSGEFSYLRVRYMLSKDTRSLNPEPQVFYPSFSADFKGNSTDGLNDGGSYHGVLSFRTYGSGADFSGGPMHQMAFTQNGNLYIRKSSTATAWDTWKKVWHEGNFPIALTDTNQKIEMGGTTQYIRLAYGGKSQAFIKHSGGVEYEVYTKGSDVISAITSLAAPTIFANTISSDGGSIAFSGGLDYINFSDVTIINVPDPTASHHPATKDYVDKFAAPVATKTASATLALTDLNKFIYVNSTSALTFTIPPNSSVAFPVGTEIHFLRYGTGEVSLAPGAGVTLQSEGSKRRINAQYQVVTIKKILTDTWALFGALKS